MPLSGGLEDRVALLEERLEKVCGRLERAEARLSALGEAAPEAREELEPEPAMPSAIRDGGGFLALAGRSLLSLAGAYLIRAVTDAGTIPRGAGVALGLAYAAGCLFLAWRAAPVAKPSATVHGVVAVAIAYPLIWEATVRFGALSPAGAAILLTAVTASILAVARIRDVRGVAWAAVLAASAVPLALLRATGAIDLYAGVLIAIGIGLYWLCRSSAWYRLRWPPALAADGAVLVLAALAGWPGGPPENYRHLSPGRAALVCAALLLAYAGSFVFDLLVHRRTPAAFEFVQAALAVAVGLGGASRLSLAAGSGTGVLGGIDVVLAAVCYAAALTWERAAPADLPARSAGPWGATATPPSRERGFHLLSGLGLLLALHGAGQLWTDPSVPWALLGLACVAAAGRLARAPLAIHGMVFVLGAAVASGLPGGASRLVAGRAAGLSAAALVVLAVVLAAYAILAASPTMNPKVNRVVATTMAILAATGIAAVIVDAVVGVLTSAGAPPGRAAMACVRTVILALAAIALSYARGRTERAELGWIGIALLAVGAVKILAEDFAVGSPATLSPALAVYGGALILTPQLLRRRTSSSGREPGASRATML